MFTSRSARCAPWATPGLWNLIDQSVGHPAEGTTEVSGGPKEPSWQPIRRDAREAIAHRTSAEYD
ncbi:MAG: hypothetical protein ACJ71Q_09435 [Terriglobales bacterium]